MSGDSSEGKEFLGAGIAFPLQLDGQGRVLMRSHEDHVRESILLILKTARGERVMRPDFGAGLESYVFESMGGGTPALIQHQVKKALVRSEPRIEVLGVDVSSDQKQEGVLTISVRYKVRRTDTQFNLVFPFYLERGEF